MEEKKSKHGGARIGCGRQHPPTKKIVTITLDIVLVEMVKEKGLKLSTVLNEALKEILKET